MQGLCDWRSNKEVVSSARMEGPRGRDHGCTQDDDYVPFVLRHGPHELRHMRHLGLIGPANEVRLLKMLLIHAACQEHMIVHGRMQVADLVRWLVFVPNTASVLPFAAASFKSSLSCVCT